MSTAMLTVRTDDRLKRSVGKTLKEIGLNHSTAINIFYHAIEKYHGIPFPVAIPNKKTVAAIKELEAGEGETFEIVREAGVVLLEDQLLQSFF